MYDTSQFQKELQSWNIELSDTQINQLIRYYELLVEWNEKMNLTAITDFNEVMTKHFLDSISIIKYFSSVKEYSSIISKNDSNTKYRMIDVGTGAGFPGIPIKIVFPGIEIVLLDSLQKRVNFLDCVIKELHLEGISTIHARAEDGGRNSVYREKFDFAVSRAVSNISTLSEYCLPFLKVNGEFISYKSEKLQEELKEAKEGIKKLGGKEKDRIDFILPDTDIKRTLYIIQKIKRTDQRYPRKAGIPLKEPMR